MPKARDRDPLHQYIGGEAAELRTQHRKARGKQKLQIQGAALDLLRLLNPPESLVVLFDTLLGGVMTRVMATQPVEPWLNAAAQFEARELQKGSRVTNRRIADFLCEEGYIKNGWDGHEWAERRMKGVRNIRKPFAEIVREEGCAPRWVSHLRPEQRQYRWLVRAHQLCIIDGEEK